MPLNLSPNMNLPVPVVGQEPGPQWALDVNNCLTLIDQHDHTSGSGVPVTPNGLNINSSLPMNNNPLAATASVGFFVQTSDAPADSAYVKGVDLYFRDGNGNVIRITQSGSVTGSTGTITGLPSGTASASYGAGVFVFQSATSTAANIDGGSFVLRNGTANSKGLTLSPPNAMAVNYSLVLPIIPSQTNVMILDTSGNMGSITYDQVGQNMTATGADAIAASMDATGANDIGSVMTAMGANAVANSRTRTVSGSAAPAGGILIAGASGGFTTASTSYTNVTSLNGTLVCTGRPVIVFLASTGNLSGVGQVYSSGVNGQISSAQIQITRDGSTVGQANIAGITFQGQQSLVPPGSVIFIDQPTAGTHTYNVQVLTNTPSLLAAVFACQLVAYEL